jgi:hypothetical protein
MAESTPQYRPIPNRDAYATIRGYLYQALLAVQAWDALKEDELLELEAGEDIDWVALPDGATSLGEADRVLGQAKFLSRNLTLRSPEALECVVRYWQHQNANPGLRLRFRFISNAEVGVERQAKHQSGLAGIELWTSLHSPRELPEDEIAGRLTHLSNLISNATKPADLPIELWAKFQEGFAALDSARLLAFIQGFTWMVGGKSVDGLFESIIGHIGTRTELEGHPDAGKHCVDSLLRKVLQELSHPGEKQLTAAAYRAAIRQSLENALNAANSGLATTYDRLKKTVDDFSGTQQVFAETVSKVSAVLAVCAPGQSPIHFSPPVPIFLAPPLASPPAPRQKLMADVEAIFASGKGALLQGEMEAGKTQAARIICCRFASFHWIGFATNSGISAAHLVDAALSRLQNDLLTSSGVSSNASPSRTVLVFDDLHSVAWDKAFAERFVTIVASLLSSSVAVLATSRSPLPSALTPVFETVNLGGYVEDDYLILLREYGAPQARRTSKFAGFLAAVTKGQPLLATAVLNYLRKGNWVVDSHAFMSLLDGSFAQDVRLEIQKRLLATEDAESRQLLYRVRLADMPLSVQQAAELAHIPPEITNVQERIVSLSGVWLRYTPEDRFEATPLIPQTFQENLARDVSNKIHDCAANWILRKEAIDQYEGTNAICHLMGAEQYDRAGFVLIRGLQAILASEYPAPSSPLLMLWANLPLPSSMSILLQIMLRGLQVAARANAAQDYSYVASDLKQLLGLVNDDLGRYSAMGACGYAAIYLWKAEPQLALEFTAISLAYERSVPSLVGEISKPEYTIAEYLWLLAARLKTVSGIDSWFGVADELDTHQRERFLGSVCRSDAAWMIFDQFVMYEQNKPQNERDWNALLVHLSKWEARSRTGGYHLLEACAIRAQQAIRIVHLGRITEAESAARNYLAESTDDAIASFLLTEGTASYLADGDRWRDARGWFERATTMHFEGAAHLRMRACVRLAEARFRAGEDPRSAFEGALTIARLDSGLTDLDEVACLGEMGTWLWLKSDKQLCFDVWEQAVSLLCANKERGQRWKNLFVIVGNHITCFRATSAGDVLGPDVTEPRLGFFFADLKDVSRLYCEGTHWILLGLMSFWAEELGDSQRAGDWALRAVEAAETISADPNGRLLFLNAISNRLQARDYDSAIDFALKSAISTIGRQPLKASPELLELHPELGRVKSVAAIPQSVAEKHAVVLGAFPAFLSIVASSVSDESRAYGYSGSLIDKCRSVAETSSNRDLWIAACDGMSEAVAGNFDRSFLVESPVHENSDPELLKLLLVSFGAGFADRTPLRELFTGTVRWASYLDHSFQLSRLVQAFAASALAQYWSVVVAKHGFLFRQPLVTSRLLASADRPQTISGVFLIVADSFGFCVPEELRHQLESNENSRKRFSRKGDAQAASESQVQR